MDEVIERLNKNQTMIHIGRLPQKYKELYNLIAENEFNGDKGATMRFLNLIYSQYKNQVDLKNVKKVMGNGQV